MGAFGLIAQRRGWDYEDLDISEVAVQFAQALGLRARVIQDRVPDIPESSVDLIVMWEVIEHIWNVSEYLTTIRVALRPNGMLLLSTPNYFRSCYQTTDEWGTSGPPVHLQFFTPESLKATLSLAGFRTVHLHRRRVWRPSRLSFGEVIRSARMAAGLEAPPTLYAFATVPSLRER